MNPIEGTETALDELRRFWSGRRAVLILTSLSAAARGVIDELTACGAEVSAVVTAGRPSADAPSVAHVWSFADRGIELTRDALDAALQDPPLELTRWLDAIDPHRSLLVVGSGFTHIGELCGRPVHGWRRPEWAVWEDKTRIEELWASIGVPSPAHVIMSSADDALGQHVAALDRGLGVVLAVDSTQGFRGDSTGLRWVTNNAELAAAQRWYRGRTDRLRIAEFVAGTPCSILGMVLADGVAVFDPVEIVTLHHQDRHSLVFCGSSTWWRPDPAAAEQMRECTRSAGRRLASLGYRGMFSVDGVLGVDRFLATELNPRHASGLGLRAGWPQFPIYLYQRAVQEGLCGLYDIPAYSVQQAFRSKVRDRPSYSVRVPSDCSGPTAERMVAVRTGDGVERTVQCRMEPGAARLVSIDPVGPAGAAAPVAAALARALGHPELRSFPTAPSAGSTPPAVRPPAVRRDITDEELGLFGAQGWALLPGLIDNAAIEQIRAEAHRFMGEYAECGKQATEPFRSIWRTYDEPSHESSALWEFATSAAIGRLGSRLLGDRPVRYLRDEFYVKMPHRDFEGRPTPWHQDYPYANRDRSGQVNFWIALNDIGIDGGALRYLSGSQRAGVLGRALADPDNDLLAQYPELLEQYPPSPPLAMVAGDVLVHHGLTVHSAPANLSPHARWAYTVVIFQADALYTGAPWPRRLAEKMSELRANEPFDHALTPVTWPPAGGADCPLTPLTSARKKEYQ